MSHTPGPWFNANGMDDCNVYVATTDKTSTIRIVSCHGVFVEGERKANARLIAAAPELLKAVKQAIDDLDDIKTLINSGNVPDNINKSIALKIRDLCTIADKAEGRD